MTWCIYKIIIITYILYKGIYYVLSELMVVKLSTYIMCSVILYSLNSILYQIKTHLYQLSYLIGRRRSGISKGRHINNDR